MTKKMALMEKTWVPARVVSNLNFFLNALCLGQSHSSLDPALPVGTTYRQVNGKYYVFEDDELKTEEDEIGNTKIDINGNLLGGA